MHVEESVTVRRPAAVVFSYLEERTHDSEWMVSVSESEWLDPAQQIGVGRRGRMVMKVMGRRAEYVDEVSEYVPGRRIAHRTIEGPLPLSTACICEPVDGGCRVTVLGETERAPGGRVLGPLIAPVVARVVRRGFREDLARLKTVLEGKGPAGGGREVR